MYMYSTKSSDDLFACRGSSAPRLSTSHQSILICVMKRQAPHLLSHLHYVRLYGETTSVLSHRSCVTTGRLVKACRWTGGRSVKLNCSMECLNQPSPRTNIS